LDPKTKAVIPKPNKALQGGPVLAAHCRILVKDFGWFVFTF